MTSSSLYKGRWLYYPWLKDSKMDDLIHPEDIQGLLGLGVVECIDTENEFLIVKEKQRLIRVKPEGVKKELPSPRFTYGNKVLELEKPVNEAIIDDLFWHHNKSEFLYYLRVNGKRKSKQYSKNDLKGLI